MFNRRHFLTRSSAAAATVLGFPHVARPADPFQARPGQKPAHIIHMVADGMSMGTFSCGDHLSHALRGRGLTWVKVNNRPGAVTAWMNMRSLNSLVTDSSAASSSWGSGSRVINGVLNELPNGTSLKTLYELFDQAAWKRGLVTTTEITHATPAGFAANSDDRDTAPAIAAQYLDRRVDVLLGGGQKFFDPKQRKDKRDLKGDFRSAGYQVMQVRDELLAAPLDKRWLGIFDSSHLPFTVDQVHDPKLQAKVPTLAEMTRQALRWLGRHPRFILQVEGGRVDHACHNADAAAALRDLIAFDEALDVCLEFQKQSPDTLIVITTDHGNGNLGLNGTGKAYGQSSFLLEHLLSVKKSFPELLKLLRKAETVKARDYPAKLAKAKAVNPKAHPARAEQVLTDVGADPDEYQEAAASGTASSEDKEVITVRPTSEIIEMLHAHAGYKPSPRRAEMLAPYLSKRSVALYDAMNSDVAALGQVLANHLGIGWTSTAHTGDFVLLTALGPGAERFRGFVQNTDVFYHYLALADIDYRNPSEPLCAEYTGENDVVEKVEEYKLC